MKSSTWVLLGALCAAGLLLAATATAEVIINEIDANTAGADILEFVELYNTGGEAALLDGMTVVFFNGNDASDLSYAAYNLNGYSIPAGGYFLLGNAGVVPAPSITFAVNFLQNGQDAVALYNGSFSVGSSPTTVNLLDAIVYDTDDADDAGLLMLLNPGQPQVNENMHSNSAAHSLQRIPNGGGGARNTITYRAGLPTPGAENIIPPDMTVRGDGNVINDNDTTPDAADFTLFGATDVTGGQITKTYFIFNTGLGDLAIDNITITGPAAADFSVTAAPAATIAPSGNSTFSVTFDPSTDGVRSATINIANNDKNKNPYDFAVQGTGGSYPEILVTGNGIEIIDPDTMPETADGTDFGYDLVGFAPYAPEHTFVIRNTGSQTLNLTSTPRIALPGSDPDFSLVQDAPASIAPGDNATFTLAFAAQAAGLRKGYVYIDNNDPDESVYQFFIQGTGYSGALMIVQGGSPFLDISPGDTAPEGADGTDFGLVEAGLTQDSTFKIKNLGDGSLTLSGDPCVALTDNASGGFAVMEQPGASFASGDNDTFSIRFSPSAVGLCTATVEIAGNDPGRCPYRFTIQGAAPGDPAVATGAADNITTDSAMLRGALTDTGYPAPHEHGFVWNTAGMPSLADTVIANGALAVSTPFSALLSGLAPSTTYYVRAYASNTGGTVYGNQRQFATLALPTTTTTAATTTTTASACTDADGDGYGGGCSPGADCDDADPFYNKICPDCEVKIIPKTLGWLIGDKEKTRNLLVIGARGTEFDDNATIKWEADAIEVLSTRAFFKRFMFMRAKFNGEPLEKKDYRVLIGTCEGKITWAK